MTTIKTIAAAATVVLAASLAGSAAQAAGGREQGTTSNPNCIAYEHRDYGGARMSTYKGRGWSYVGGAWNDKISSFKIGKGCYVQAWHHRDYQGEITTFSGYVKYVGDLWNDQISSWKCKC